MLARKMIVGQLRHEWVINLLLFLTMTALVSLYVFIQNTHQFSVRSMQLIMKGMGLNQLMIPKSQSALDSYLCTDNQLDFPEETTQIAASHTELLSKYYLSVLQERMEFAGHVLLLTGIEPVYRPDETEEKGNPVKPVQRETARLGCGAAKVLGLLAGDKIKIASQDFSVVKVLSEQGTLDDYRIFLNLSDAQELLGRPGKINAILSFECLHVGGSLESIHKVQRDMLSRVLPGFQQINVESIARGRYYARQMNEKYQYCLLSLVATITVLIVVMTGFQEVAERRYETGILVAQGAGYLYLIGLYLFKTWILALLAAGTGFLIGGLASILLTNPFLATQTREVTLLWENLPRTMAMIVFVATIAEFIPMIRLVRMDPCLIVMEE